MLTAVPITTDSKDFKEIKHLYIAAFPKSERVPLRDLLRHDGASEFVAGYDGETFCGFYSALTFGDITHILFLAIDERLRAHGYGSAMLDIVAAGEPFKIYGLLPMQLVNYTQATVPVILVVWILSYVHKWVKKVVPDFIRTIGVPVLTTFIMIPLTFCVFGPICNEIMSWVGSAILWMNNTIGVPTIVVVAAIWPFVIMFGMHVPVMMALLPTWMEMGYDAIVSPATIASNLAGIGVELAYALRAGSRENKELGWTCFVTHVTANISEPALYGIFLRDRKALAWDMLGAVAGGVTMGLLGGKVTLFSGVGFPFLEFLRFGEYSVPGAIGMVVAFGVSLALGLVFGFEKAQQKN